MSEYSKDINANEEIPKKRDFDVISSVATVAAVGGATILATNWHDTAKALDFLGPNGQGGRQAYVSAQHTQEDLVEARNDQPSGDPYIRVVTGVSSDKSLQHDVVTLTNEPLPNNQWLTPQETYASPLLGIGGIIICASGLAAVASRRFTKYQDKRRGRESK